MTFSGKTFLVALLFCFFALTEIYTSFCRGYVLYHISFFKVCVAPLAAILPIDYIRTNNFNLVLKNLEVYIALLLLIHRSVASPIWTDPKAFSVSKIVHQMFAITIEFTRYFFFGYGLVYVLFLKVYTLTMRHITERDSIEDRRVFEVNK